MFCWKCGKELTKDAKFCWACGTKVYAEENSNKQTILPKDTVRTQETTICNLSQNQSPNDTQSAKTTRIDANTEVIYSQNPTEEKNTHSENPKSKNEKKKRSLVFAIIVIIIAIFAPKIYKSITNKLAQNALISDATTSIQAICQKYNIDEYEMDVVFLEGSDILYYINLTAFDSDISQSQISSFASEVWDYSYKDPNHYWSRSASGEVKINDRYYHAGGLTSQEWFEKEREQDRTSTTTQAVDSGARHTDSEAWSCATKIVKDSLKSPSTAKFCSFTECNVTHLGNGEYMVTGWVEAQNSFGATLRQSFVVTYTATERGYKNGVAIID